MVIIVDADYGFIEGIIYDDNWYIVIASSEKLEEDNVEHAFICKYKNGIWKFWYEDFSVIKICSFEGHNGPVLIEMGKNGEIVTGDSKGFRTEIIDDSDEAPSALRALNDIKLIDDYVYVAGMRRQVYRRLSNGNIWERYDEGMLVSKISKEISGFLSIDGFNNSEIYAVGYGGEIWYFNGKSWKKVDTPTNLRLESIHCFNGEYAIAVGHAGIILRGRKDVWEIIPQDETMETFWDVDSIRKTIYITTDVGIIYKIENNKLIEIDTGFPDITTGSLHSNGNSLLSIGEKDILLTDNTYWKKVDPPILPTL